MLRSPDRSRRAVPALLALALCGLAACGADPSGSSATSASTAPSSMSSGAAPSSGSSGQAAGAETIHIEDFGYRVPDTVAPGSTVTVMNMDGQAHTVTADEGDAFDVKVDGDGSATFTAPTTPGSYAFHCTYHGNMHGTLVVG